MNKKLFLLLSVFLLLVKMCCAMEESSSSDSEVELTRKGRDNSTFMQGYKGKNNGDGGFSNNYTMKDTIIYSEKKDKQRVQEENNFEESEQVVQIEELDEMKLRDNVPYKGYSLWNNDFNQQQESEVDRMNQGINYSSSEGLSVPYAHNNMISNELKYANGMNRTRDSVSFNQEEGSTNNNLIGNLQDANRVDQSSDEVYLDLNLLANENGQRIRLSQIDRMLNQRKEINSQLSQFDDVFKQHVEAGIRRFVPSLLPAEPTKGCLQPDIIEMEKELVAIDKWKKYVKRTDTTHFVHHACSYALARKYFKMDKEAPLGADIYDEKIIKRLIKLIACRVIDLQLEETKSQGWLETLFKSSHPIYDLGVGFAKIIIPGGIGTSPEGHYSKCRLSTSNPAFLKKQIESWPKIECHMKEISLEKLLVPSALRVFKNLQKLVIYGSDCERLEISPKVFLLSKLSSLALVHSSQASLAAFDKIDICTSLRELHLSNNSLIDLPNQIFALTYLTVLGLSKNRFEKVSPLISNLINLEKLYLDENQLIKLPDAIGLLSKLQMLNLNLQKNEIKGRMDKLRISKCTELRELNLSGNNLDVIPNAVISLTNLTKLDLSHNTLKKVDKIISQLSRLTILNLSRNQLSEVAQEISKLTHLQELDLKNNKLEVLSPSITALKKLRILNLNSNNSIETLPKNMTQMIQLNKLSLSRISKKHKEIKETYSVQQWKKKKPKLFA